MGSTCGATVDENCKHICERDTNICGQDAGNDDDSSVTVDM